MKKPLYRSYLNSIKGYTVNFSLYRFGVQFCENMLLPRLINRLEPLRDQSSHMSVLPEIDSLVTEHELKEILDKYQFADKYLKLGLLGLLILVAVVVSFLSRTVTYGIVISILFLSELTSFVFLLGVYMRVRSRWMKWQEIRQREIQVEKIEYYAKVTSSKIIAQVLVDIERAKDAQKHEAEKARAHSAIQSVMQTENLKIFEEIMDKREGRNKWKEFRKQTGFFILGYVAGKGLDLISGKIINTNS